MGDVIRSLGIRCRDCRFEDIDALVHLRSVRVGSAVAVQVRSSTDEGECGVRQVAHFITFVFWAVQMWGCTEASSATVSVPLVRNLR